MRKLQIAVLTCDGLGYETARALSNLSSVERVTVVESPQLRPQNVWRRIKLAYTRLGPVGCFRRVVQKPFRPLQNADAVIDPPMHYIKVSRFHNRDGLNAIRSLQPDLVVVDGTYILRESVFSIARLGTINLHCGYLPDYKGSPPAFWELFEGESSVGVSVHFVSGELDGGPIIERRRFPLDPAPDCDPIEYTRMIWCDVLRPAGIEMLCNAVTAASEGRLQATSQSSQGERIYRTPDYRQVRELRRRVAARRKGSGQETCDMPSSSTPAVRRCD
jgi:folate-dependent phosphoribosylglycinamide formyltransferase PurN